MTRPTWVIFFSFFLVLIGSCSFYKNIRITQDSSIIQFLQSIDEEDSKNIKDVDDSLNLQFKSVMDTLDKNAKDSNREEFPSLFGKDSIINDNADFNITAITKPKTQVSNFRKKWDKRFAWVAIFISILFIITSILLWFKNRFSLLFIKSILGGSIASEIINFLILSTDQDSGNFVNIISQAGIFTSIAVDLILLITIIFIDKTYFKLDKYDKT